MPQVENITVSFENLPSLLHSDSANKAVTDDNTYNLTLPVLEFHYKKWRGTGCIYRFKGKGFPLPARIFSVIGVSG